MTMTDGDPTEAELAQYQLDREMIAKAAERAKTTSREVVETWLKIRELTTRYNQLVSTLIGSIRDSEDFYRAGDPCPPYVVWVGEASYVITHNSAGAPPAERITITPCRVV